MAEKKEKLTDEMRQALIDANMHLVPKDTLEGKWNTWDVKKRYTMVRSYLRKNDTTPKPVKYVLKSIEANHLTYDDLEILIEKVKELQNEILAPMLKKMEEDHLKEAEKIKALKEKMNKI